MVKNVAGWDRGIRIALGLALLLATVVGPQTLWGLAGFVLIGTGLVGFCPLYRLVGVSTCSIQPRDPRGLSITK